MITFASYSQAPEITISTTTLSADLNPGDTSVVTLVIENTGNRDLHYEVGIMGHPVDFERPNFGDWEWPENQDRIMPDVWITRDYSDGPFNAATESSYNSDSPEGTEWYNGPTAEAEPGDYNLDFKDAQGWNMRSLPGSVMSLHLTNWDIFFDVLWHSWISDDNGGFSYTRTEIPRWVWPVEDMGVVVPTLTDTLELVMDTRVNSLLRSAVLVIYSDDPENPMLTVDLELTINGGETEVAMPDTVMDFEDTQIGGSSMLALEICNTGQGTLEIISIENDSDVFVPSVMPMEIIGGDKNKLMVEFSPTAVQYYEDTIIITTNDVLKPTLSVIVSGTGIAPADVAVSPDSFTGHVVYGDGVEYGDMDTMLLIIANPGEGELYWEARAIVPGAEPVFFEKENFTDFEDPMWQDRISDNVWITRRDQRGIFNAATESEYNFNSPEGTLWYDGPTGETSRWDYDEGIRNAFGSLGNLPGNTLSMYVEETEEFHDVTFHSWTSGGAGGG